MDSNVYAVKQLSPCTHASYPATNIAATSQCVLNTSTFSTNIQKLSMGPASDDNPAMNSVISTNNSLLSFDLIPEEVLVKRRRLHDAFLKRLEQKKELYIEILTELFFLQNGGNSMDFVQFKKRPSSKLLDFLKRSRLDAHHLRSKNRENLTSIDPISPASDFSIYSKSSTKYSSDENGRLKLCTDTEETNEKSFEVLNERDTQHSEAKLFSQEKSDIGSQKNPPKFFRISGTHLQNHVTLAPHVARQELLSRNNPQTMLDETIDSQEEILERAKQEAVIQRKVVELRKQGLWTQRRLPKVQEPPRNKTHWDYLLEEMRWLAADFAQERKWKRAAARKLVRTVASYHKDQHGKVKKAEREEHQKLRRIASTMAREIKIFWNSIEKVVEYKQQSLLDEKRQKALDIHLSYIVDQTEKYSNWLSQGLNKMDSASSCPSPTNSNMKSSCDDDFLPQGESSDDEATIAVEEEELSKGDDHEDEDELSLLKKESQLPLEEWLQTLPTEIIENVGKPWVTVANKDNLLQDEVQSSLSSQDEDELKPTPISLRRSARKRKIESNELDTGTEKMIKIEQNTDYKVEPSKQTVLENEDTPNEISALQVEASMPIEQLKKLYDGAFDENSVEKNDNQTDNDTESESECDSNSSEVAEEIGMDYLLNTNLSNEDDTLLLVPPSEECTKEKDGVSTPSKEITDVAAEAASLQPTGHTLATTQVVTPIPSLLRHDLREYQHIGLDWLVTMFDKRLNGILADEMGLGKTIQTIALLAHLACEKGVWGPHLIVVPTSVMLNWEMEFKKWCPGFKILTYYGSQKERKMKRVGWTKSNAFHVCITSYKLVLQDHVSFRRKKWKYLVLDEAQNIKNFKSQRWQTLLNFNSQRRLLLTGTPLQNNLMELWSLMHFLMPHVFQSHKEFKEWFSNPLTGMIEGSQDYNEKLVRRLHKVLRPFLLRRIKREVEKQMPNKYEHIVRCHLSKRQRFLYDDFMSRSATKETLDSGHFMSVINVLMQLRKVCNHPNLFESRPIVSPFISIQIIFHTASLVTKVLHKDPFETLNLTDHHFHLPTLCRFSQYHAHRIKKLEAPRKLIEEISVRPARLQRQPSHKFGVCEQLNLLLKNPEHITKVASDSKTVVHLNNSLGISLPIGSGTGTGAVQAASTKPIFSSKVLAISQPKMESTAIPQIAMQYQTPQGVRVSIPNKQIRQLSGGYVQIVPAIAAKPDQVIKANTVRSPGISFEDKTRQLPKTSTDTLAEALSKDPTDTSIPELYEAGIERARTKEQKDSRNRMALLNKRNCEVSPDWLPYDTIKLLETVFLLSQSSLRKVQDCDRKTESFVTKQLIKNGDAIAAEMKPFTDRFVFPTHKVESIPVLLCVSRPPPCHQKQLRNYEDLQIQLSHQLNSFHHIKQNMQIQFPDVRLVQYDCGKLQILDILLRRFWTEKHRCLIFTQMSRVLDILETFLSFHGYRYLRLDGSTKVEQRMSLIERFNNDDRIFCFILSTRSGGVGVNLTGADTVIFYDSDWNPTMDAQAQDRCHRIGQTRDVHIYRLISERTVEENILKKANQKRLLGDLAIEGGSFTTAFFKEQAIKDLFTQPTGLDDLTTNEDQSKEKRTELSKPMTARQKTIAAAKLAKSTDAVTNKEGAAHTTEESKDAIQEPNTWEDALQETEEKEDVDAAKLAKKEQDADLEEFSGNVEDEEVIEAPMSKSELSKVQIEMKSLYAELTPIEQYALRYLEETTMEINNEELEQAEEQVTKSKKDWEMSHLMALKEEEERRLEEEDEIFYVREDMEIQVTDGKKGVKRRKKGRDICFLDMSTSSEEEEVSVDIETLENRSEKEENSVYDDDSCHAMKTKLQTFKKSRSVRGRSSGRGGGIRNRKSGAGRLEGSNKRGSSWRNSSPNIVNSNKRRRASELAYDITTHGYYQNDDFYYYNDDDEEDSICGEADDDGWEGGNDNLLGDAYANPWSEEEWPSSEEERIEEDEIIYDRASSNFDESAHGITQKELNNKRKLVGGTNKVKITNYSSVNTTPSHTNKNHPFYNIVVETNASSVTPKISQKPRLDVSAISQKVNKTISFSRLALNQGLTKSNIIPTISLKTQSPLANQPSFSVQQAVLSSKNGNRLSSNAIYEQQALQRQKLQSYKIPLISSRFANQPVPRQKNQYSTQSNIYNTILPKQPQTGNASVLLPGSNHNQALFIKSTKGANTAIIPLSQLKSSRINFAPVAHSIPGKFIAISTNQGVRPLAAPPRTAAIMVPISNLTSSQQTYFIQHSASGQPIHIIANSSQNICTQSATTANPVLQTRVASTATSIGVTTRKPTTKFSRSLLNNVIKRNEQTPTKKLDELDRGIFDIVNSIEFMSPPLHEPIIAPTSNKAGNDSLFDSLEQEFFKDGGCDLTVGSGDEDDMITLDLEPVSPSDPQIVDTLHNDDNEEERNVFESFQSLLQQ